MQIRKFKRSSIFFVIRAYLHVNVLFSFLACCFSIHHWFILPFHVPEDWHFKIAPYARLNHVSSGLNFVMLENDLF